MCIGSWELSAGYLEIAKITMEFAASYRIHGAKRQDNKSTKLSSSASPDRSHPNSVRGGRPRARPFKTTIAPMKSSDREIFLLCRESSVISNFEDPRN